MSLSRKSLSFFDKEQTKEIKGMDKLFTFKTYQEAVVHLKQISDLEKFKIYQYLFVRITEILNNKTNISTEGEELWKQVSFIDEVLLDKKDEKKNKRSLSELVKDKEFLVKEFLETSFLSPSKESLSKQIAGCKHKGKDVCCICKGTDSFLFGHLRYLHEKIDSDEPNKECTFHEKCLKKYYRSVGLGGKSSGIRGENSCYKCPHCEVAIPQGKLLMTITKIEPWCRITETSETVIEQDKLVIKEALIIVGIIIMLQLLRTFLGVKFSGGRKRRKTYKKRK